MIPDALDISDEEMQHCRETGNYIPVVLEWYKFLGSLCETFANLRQETEAVRNDIEKRNYGILIGLLNRCARLMLANTTLSHEGRFGESTSILDRSIFESCVILSWLSNTEGETPFDRYIASGLRTEIELKEQIVQSIESRNGVVLKIERRMLNSIGKCLLEAGFTEEKVTETKRLPNLASMLDALGHKRIAYTAGQRISSHHVHGTWVGLRNHYIQLGEDGDYRTRQETETHINQYIYIIYMILDALTDFVSYVFVAEDDATKAILDLFEATHEEVSKLNDEIMGADYSEA